MLLHSFTNIMYINVKINGGKTPVVPHAGLMVHLGQVLHNIIDWCRVCVGVGGEITSLSFVFVNEGRLDNHYKQCKIYVIKHCCGNEYI